MFWKDIWKEEPLRNKEILFKTGDGDIHLGEIYSEEKLRKVSFHSFTSKDDYSCDANTPLNDRVLWWFPLPDEEPEHEI